MNITINIDGDGERVFSFVNEFSWDLYDGLRVVTDEGTFHFAEEEVLGGDFEKEY